MKTIHIEIVVEDTEDTQSLLDMVAVESSEINGTVILEVEMPSTPKEVDRSKEVNGE